MADSGSSSESVLLKIEDANIQKSKMFKFNKGDKLRRVFDEAVSKFQPDADSPLDVYRLLYMGVEMDLERTIVSYGVKNKEKLLLTSRALDDSAAVAAAVEDSPVLRTQLKVREEQIDAWKSELKKLSKAGREHAGKAAGVAPSVRTLHEELAKFCVPSDHAQHPRYAKAVTSFTRLEQQLEGLYAGQGEAVTGNFVTPLEHFLDFEFGEAKEKLKRLERARREYDTAIERHKTALKKKSVTPDVIMAVENAVTTLKYQLDHRSADYKEVLEDMERKKESKVLAMLFELVNAQRQFFEDGFRVFSDMAEEMSELQSFLERGKEQQGADSFEGFLHKASKSGMLWHRCWFTLRDGYLSWMKKGKDSQSSGLSVVMCTVKPMPPGEASKPNSFQIISLDRTLTLYADTEEDMHAWVSHLQDAILRYLNEMKSGTKSTATGEASAADGGAEEAARLEVLYEQNPSNRQCADCGAEDPTWISINIGAIVCIECSGIHRSIGTHITKVRSATLDKLEDLVQRCLMAMGNDKVNALWEARLAEVLEADPGSISKPNATTGREAREAYIRAKYEARTFMHPPDEHIEGRPIDSLFHAVEQNDLQRISLCRGSGVDLNVPNPVWNDKTALHHAIIHDRPLAAEWVFQNGGNVDAADKNGATPLHDAAALCKPFWVQWLLAKGASRTLTNDSGQTAYQLAESFVEHADEADDDDDVADGRMCLRIFRGESISFEVLEVEGGKIMFGVRAVGRPGAAHPAAAAAAASSSSASSSAAASPGHSRSPSSATDSAGAGSDLEGGGAGRSPFAFAAAMGMGLAGVQPAAGSAAGSSNRGRKETVATSTPASRQKPPPSLPPKRGARATAAERPQSMYGGPPARPPPKLQQ